MNTKDCEYFEQRLSSRLDEELPSEQQHELENHLAVCPSCRDFDIELTSQRRILQSLPDVVVPDGFRAVPNTLKWWRRRLSLPLPVAAAIALIAIGGWLLALRSPAKSNIEMSVTPIMVHSVETVRVPAVQAVRVESEQDISKDNEEEVL